MFNIIKLQNATHKKYFVKLREVQNPTGVVMIRQLWGAGSLDQFHLVHNLYSY